MIKRLPYKDLTFFLLTYKESKFHWPNFKIIHYPLTSGFVFSVYFWIGYRFFDLKFGEK